ncbi:pyrroline-5-carboxylate reductase [Aquipuribacter nitratireducens]|uniref:Pyrroline-5-carboxylate reductase n=1 Tax=Aquipuribacter nitratireducens TaxID=650104 RepID=A0ABW0GS90_9MICO
MSGTSDRPGADVVAVLGAGVMGETLLSGLLRAGRAAEALLVTERRPERAQELTHRYGVRVVDTATAVQEAGTLVLVVKPQDVPSLLADVAPHLRAGTLVVSLAAGVTTAALEHGLVAGGGPHVPVVRVMPNTPALVDEGMSAIAAGTGSGPEHLDAAEALLGAVGKVVRVPEHHMDAVTAVSGSGPAYVFYVVEAMIEAGVLLGLSREVATTLVVQTVVGAGRMVAETGQHPTVLREQVSSPAGTTMAAVRVLDDHRVRAAFVTAMEAARDRSAELGRLAGS